MKFKPYLPQSPGSPLSSDDDEQGRVRIALGSGETDGKSGLIVLAVELWGPDGKRSETVPMALDTGARCSEVDVLVMQKLGYGTNDPSGKPSRVFTGINWVYGYTVPIFQLKIDKIILKDLKINMTRLDSKLEFRGLLGLNFLEAISRVSIDCKRGILELYPLK